MINSIALAVQVHNNSNEMDTIGKPFQNQSWNNYVPTYDGHKDRYDITKLQNDPEVLVSTPNKKNEITTVINVEPIAKDEPQLLVKASVGSDEFADSVPVECITEDNLITCDWK